MRITKNILPSLTRAGAMVAITASLVGGIPQSDATEYQNGLMYGGVPSNDAPKASTACPSTHACDAHGGPEGLNEQERKLAKRIGKCTAAVVGAFIPVADEVVAAKTVAEGAQRAAGPVIGGGAGCL